MVTKQEELIYHAFRNPSLREQEREEIARKTAEYEQRKAIEVVPFGVSGEKEYQPIKSAHSAKIEVDITGQKFGKLTAVKRCPTRDMASYWSLVEWRQMKSRVALNMKYSEYWGVRGAA